MRKTKRCICAMAAVMLGAGALTVAGAGTGKTVYAQEAENPLLQEQRLNTWYSQAIQSINDGDYKNALMCLDGCMIYCTQESNAVLYADLFMKRGYCCLMLEQYDEALEALDTALETDPELANAILIKASVYSETGKLEESIAELEHYVSVSGDDSAYESMAALYEAMGDPAGAIESYQKYAATQASDKAEELYLCGTYQMGNGRYEEAIDFFTQCLEEETPVDGAFYNRGQCYMAMGDYEAAIQDFGASAEKESLAEEALYTKATCEMTVLDYDSAVADFTACIDQDIHADDSRINRGICLMLAGKSDEARQDFDECVEQDINADEARFYRSFISAAAEEYDRALEDLTACIDHGYDLAASYQQRASVYKAMGDEEKSAADQAAAKQALESAQAAAQEESPESISEAATEG